MERICDDSSCMVKKPEKFCWSDVEQCRIVARQINDGEALLSRDRMNAFLCFRFLQMKRIHEEIRLRKRQPFRPSRRKPPDFLRQEQRRVGHDFGLTPRELLHERGGSVFAHRNLRESCNVLAEPVVHTLGQLPHAERTRIRDAAILRHARREIKSADVTAGGIPELVAADNAPIVSLAELTRSFLRPLRCHDDGTLLDVLSLKAMKRLLIEHFLSDPARQLHHVFFLLLPVLEPRIRQLVFHTFVV